MRRAASSASASLRAPETSTVTSLVAPSPSRASSRASSPATSSSAARSAAAPGLRADVMRRAPDAPFARITALSLVEVSPSTVTRLSVASATSRQSARR